MKNNKKPLLFALTAISLLSFSCSTNPSSTPNSDNPITSEVKKTYFKIDLESGEGYTVSAYEGYDKDKAEQGKDFKFVVLPKEGYAIRAVKILGNDDILLPDDNNVYTLPNVNENISIKILAKLKGLSVVFSGEHFSIKVLDGVDKNDIQYGSSLRFQLTANDHYSLVSIKLDGTDLVKDGEGAYTIPEIKSNKVVEVVTKEDTYKLTVLPNEYANVEFEKPDLNFDAIGYFSDVKFKVTPVKYYNVTSVKVGGKELSIDVDGYYHIRNQVGKVTLSLITELIRCQVQFVTGCSLSYDPVVVNAGTTLTSLPTPTRSEDEYYESYTFEGWYTSVGKFDISKPIESSLVLRAKWKQNGAKTVVVNEFKKEDFVTENGAFVETLDQALNSMAYENGAVNLEKKAELAAEFAYDENEGVLVNMKAKTGTVTLPKINFSSLLNDGNEIKMVIGQYNCDNALILNGKKITFNGRAPDQGVALFRRTLLTFFKGNDSKIHVTYEDRIIEKVTTEASRYGELILTDAQASGSEGLKFSTDQDANRHYLIGKPTMVKSERKYMDLSKKTGLSVSNASLKYQSENNAWAIPVMPASKGIGIVCSSLDASNPSVISFDNIDFASLFAKNEGIRFSIGTLDSEKEIAWKTADSSISVGKNAIAPVSTSDQTQATILKTWKNWTFSISASGAYAYNENEGKEYVLPLTSKQITGEEKIELDLTFKKASPNAFFLLTNLKSYKA